MNLWKKIKWFLLSGAPAVEKPKKKSTVITVKDLKNKTKKELDRLCSKEEISHQGLMAEIEHLENINIKDYLYLNKILYKK